MAVYAVGAGADLVLYSPFSEEQFEDPVSGLYQIGRIESKDYSDEEATGVARQMADSLADGVLAEFDVDWSVVTGVTDELDVKRIIELPRSGAVIPSLRSGNGGLRRGGPCSVIQPSGSF
ncbi:hypothetical protein HALLA_01735 (plasmid) [Halostagnicola larsenii XH-48]|uniref:Uncharacterized protein n=1 Tax=Halostagnicola larsenii XH-48 TaxID=797299 RepID=W0JTY3_9EURY|nr:hypothetical protein [Halostagnicola larsenii]AHG02049.1 hypothetical protein HALLA_01735 [Halostagnicola larsenii XH-48]